MRFTPAFLDDLRARVTLSDLIGRTVKVTRAGREYKACCPFHSEKTPSFTINDDKGFYHCFGCGAHGDAIRWLTDHAALSFVDAVEQLCGEAGVAVPQSSPEAARRAAAIEGQRPTLEAAQDVFRGELAKYPVPRHELSCRLIDEAVIDEFGIGFAPEDGALADRGFNRSDLMAVGLVGRSDGGFVYVRFKSRIMIPIHDHRGRIVGFGGRKLPGVSGDKTPKYVNSPESAIFDKGSTLFNLHRARELYRATRRLIIAEGYFDVVALHRMGLAAVAPMGTALTDGQLERAWRIDICPLLLFDGDKAGMKAAVRAAEGALPQLGPGRSLAIATLPEGTDPDDLFQHSIAASEDPAQALAAWLCTNRPMSAQECLLNHAIEAVDGDGPEAWSAVWKRLADWAATIADADTRALTLMHWRRRWEVAAQLIGDLSIKVPAQATADPDDADDGGDAGYWFVDGALNFAGGDARAQAMVMWLVGTYDDIADIQADQKFRLSMAKEMGFDPPMLRKMARAVIQDRDKPDARVCKEAREAAYRRAIGLKGPLTEEFLPPPFAVKALGQDGAPVRALPPPTRRIEAMTDMIEGRG